METEELLKEMDKYARVLVKWHLDDFTARDTKIVQETGAKIPFVWIVGKNGTSLFLCNVEERIWDLIRLLNTGIEKTELAYIYDGTYFRPESFENLNEWIIDILLPIL